MIKDKELGFYLPSFFFMQLNTEKDFEWLSDKSRIAGQIDSVFLHEYIHFLQDILTTNGFRNTITVVDFIKGIILPITSSPKKNFTIPYILDSDNMSVIQDDLVRVFSGDNEIDYCFTRILGVNIEKTDFIRAHPNEDIIMVITDENGSNDEKSFHFGSICLNEGIAYLIESNHFRHYQHPIFPYQVVNKLWDFYFPFTKISKENLILLCEIALNSYNPPVQFILLLQIIRDENLIPTESSIIEIARKLSLIVNENKKDYSLEEFFNEHLEKSKKALKDCIRDPKYLPLQKWVDDTFTNANIYKGNGYFFPRLAAKNGLSIINELLKLIGTPLLSNLRDEYCASNNDAEVVGELVCFRAIFEVYSILRRFSTGCSMKNYCIQHPTKNLTSEICDSRPWENTKHPSELLCPFAQFWKLWGLVNKEPEIKSV